MSMYRYMDNETLGIVRLHLVRVGDEEQHGGREQLEQGGDNADEEVARV